MIGQHDGRPKRRVDDTWHLEKRVNLGHLLAILSIAGGFFIWAIRMDSRVTKMEVDQRNLSERVDRSVIRTEGQITEINRKLDRVFESKR